MAQPPAWGAQPPAQPPAWGGPPPGSMQPWGMQAPPPKNNMLMPVMLIVGGLLILALVGVGLILATGGSKGTPAPSSAPSVVAQVTPTDNTATPSSEKTSKATPTKTAKVTDTPATGDSSVTITPATASCSGTSVTISFAWKLSGSIPGSTKISVEFDGTVAGTASTVSAIMTKQSDGNWHSNGHVASSDACSALGVGDHTVGLQDDSGGVLVEGAFSLTD